MSFKLEENASVLQGFDYIKDGETRYSNKN
jgi:hypothetical protein